METRSKKKMKHGRVRLSSLPNAILGHILSFLDTKSVIQTSLLFKNYRHAWTLPPCLDFKLTDDHSDDTSHNDPLFVPPPGIATSFETNVDRVLQQRKPSNLRYFRLSLHLMMSPDFVDRCIGYAAQHNVQHLRIRGYTELRAPVRLPGVLLNSTSLVTLRLNNAVTDTIELPMSVILPNLEGLRLKNFVFSQNNYNGQVFSGCPSLENLVLIKCSIRPEDGLKMLDVNCSNLKSLEIRNWRSSWVCLDEHMINVSAPRLVFFKFEGYLARVDFKNVMPCLEEAYIDLSCPTNCSRERMIRTSQYLLSLLDQISSVKSLSLLSKTYEIMSENPASRDTTLNLFEYVETVEVREERAMKNLKRLFWPPRC